MSSRIDDAVKYGPQIGKRIGEILHQEPGLQTYRMAAAILANATVYYDILSTHFKLKTIEEISASESPDGELIQIWRDIVRDINFYPIFHIATRLISTLGAKLAYSVTIPVLSASRDLSKLGITTLYDLLGRMFQKLIADRKFLATFYTLPSSSALLAELAIASMNRDWSNVADYPSLRVADLACGTGTLLAAAYRAILKRYEYNGLNSTNIHAELLANSVFAADIMPAATHMAAAQLSSFHPAIKLHRSRVYTVPYGEQPAESGRDISIGSLDLLDSDHIDSLFGTGAEELPPSLKESVESELLIADESLDLVIMNPPFTRPTNHRVATVPVPSFAGFSTSDAEQAGMSTKLKRINKKLINPIGNGNAGLASNFCDLAQLKIKRGGTLALVLPIVALSGTAWSRFREVLRTEYVDVLAITIANSKSEQRSFSADTSMAECLIVAQRRGEKQCQEPNWCFVTLFSRPNSVLEAVQISNRLAKSKSSEYGSLRIGTDLIGHHLTSSSQNTGLASIRSLELGRFLSNFVSKGDISIRSMETSTIKFAQLEELGETGPVHRDVGVVNSEALQHRAPFMVIDKELVGALYPMLWRHDHTRERRLLLKPDSKGEVIPGREDKAERIWQNASRLHMSLDFNTNSSALVACQTTVPSLGVRAWPSFSCLENDWEIVLLLCANSTMGLILFWWFGSKQHSGRSIVTVSKLPSLLVLDPRQLTPSQIESCKEFYESFKEKTLQPASRAATDPARLELDRFVFTELCGLSESWLSDFDVIRRQWCSEPIVNANTGSIPQ